MEFTAEQIEKAKNCKTLDEFKTLAKAEGVELSEEEAINYFNSTRTGELSDEDLSSVAGGAKGGKWELFSKAPYRVECQYCEKLVDVEVLMYRHSKTRQERSEIKPNKCSCGAIIKYAFTWRGIRIWFVK